MEGSKETKHCLIFLFSSKLTRIIKNVCGQLRMHSIHVCFYASKYTSHLLITCSDGVLHIYEWGVLCVFAVFSCCYFLLICRACYFGQSEFQCRKVDVAM